MSTPSWYLHRRTLLRGAGASLALPLLDAMTPARANQEDNLPRRMCGVYFPFGVSLPPQDHEQSQWNWFPTGEGKDFRFTNTLSSLDPLREHVTVLGGLSHPNGRSIGGHDTGDIFLTGARLSGTSYSNSISLDQRIAQHIGERTRFPSLTLSSDGGVGEPTRSTTLSFSQKGRPIPALAKPRQIFERLFGEGDAEVKNQRRQLKTSGTMLDLVLEHSRSLKRKLGTHDVRKFDEYLASVRAVEQRVDRSQRWLDIPKPEVNSESLALDASAEGPLDYIRTMYDLMYLAFQTDTTRVATYMIGQVAGATTIANTFPQALGLPGNWHGLAHGAGKKGGYEKLGRFDQFLAEQLSYFLKRLQDTPEGDATLLDRTLVFYGSSNSRTHNNNNYPLVLAGGGALGVQHGQYLKFSAKTPLSNLFVTMLDRLDVPVDAFADSTGEMSELI
ncbi:MAG TPA: hypothetical protein DCY79_02615 [Planctomycetaceae bacterium]|nr:hypothetical protein [Blastopirellula sp.]HAY78683.1 hypothetical protein [Planctomycetaceae bacterium]|tara:strand:+ start:280 stop:1614 length:1335 start_codon:yes stop_codon:yes gene_type:complete